MSSERQVDLEAYPQLLEDMRQRCVVLQHDLQDYTDAVVHRCSIIMFCHLLLTCLRNHNMLVPDHVAMHASIGHEHEHHVHNSTQLAQLLLPCWQQAHHMSKK